MMKKRFFSIMLILVLVVGMMPVSAFTTVVEKEYNNTTFWDMPNDWSAEALEKAVSNGLITGFEGRIMPKESLTRAQMAAIVSRAFGTTEMSSLSSYNDMMTDEWYYNEMAKAVQMKIFVGSDYKLYPNNDITREEAFTVLARAFKLSGADDSVLTQYSDKDLVSAWAKKETAALVTAGYAQGANGKLNPKKNITRAEFAQLMENILKNYIIEEGIYSADMNGNVMINVPNVTLKDLVITGDLIIGDGVGDGDITLDGVVVKGRTVIRGGGVNSIKIIGDSDIQNIVIARVKGQVRVFTEDGLEIGEVIVDGNDHVIIEGNTGTVTITASGITVTATNAKIAAGIIEGDNSKIIISESSTVQKAEINGENSEVIVEKGSKIVEITVNGKGADISGQGEIDKVKANADNITVSTPGTKVTASDGKTGIMAGTIPVSEKNTETVPSENTGGGRRSSNSSSGGSSSVAVTGITINGEGDANTIVNGQNLQMSATILPTNATDKTVTWSVLPLVGGTATISTTGLLTGTGVGTVRVTATNVVSGIVGTKDVTITDETPTGAEYFQFDASTGTIIRYNIEGGTDVIIPSEIDGIAVEHIGEDAFNGSGGKGSSGTPITSVIIPDSVISIGRSGFASNQLISIIIPGSVTNLGDYAFFRNPITEFNIPHSVDTIGENVFYECSELAKFTVDSNNNNYASIDGVLFSKDETTLLQYPYAKTGSYSIPDHVSDISEEAFWNCRKLTDIAIPDSVKNIGTGAFYSCIELTNITLPDSITSIGASVFSSCTGLTEVILPDSVTSIGDGSFGDCINLSTINLPTDLTSIGNRAFEYCTKLVNISIPDNVTSIGNYAFSGCEGITSIIIPSGMTSIGNYTFSACKGLTSITIPSGVTSIGDGAFSFSSELKSVTIPHTVTSIGQGTFSYCSQLTSITIPDSVTSLGRSAISNCTELTSAIISSSVTVIEDYTFYNCTKLTSITIPNNVTNIGNTAFLECTALTSVTIGSDVDFGYQAFTNYTITEYLNTAYAEGGAGTYTRNIDEYSWE
ncbi:MAG: hypothetical protein CVV02_16180 [Firmicutes bacterium HGW-Firmicutes-7]|nr:MAG: hypothetical protein CVV02_16180 [Firmicutes bacterium HGW-Firmicutes-7]